MQTYILFWSPEGRPIGYCEADNAKSALKRTPKPYRRYMGEVYAQTLEEYERTIGVFNFNRTVRV